MIENNKSVTRFQKQMKSRIVNQLLCEMKIMKKLAIIIIFAFCNHVYAESDDLKACKMVLEPVENLGHLTEKWCVDELKNVILTKRYDIKVLYNRILSQRTTSNRLVMWSSHYYAEIKEYDLALSLAEIAHKDGYKPINHGWFGYLYKQNGELKLACSWLSKSGHGEDAQNYKRYGCNNVK